MRFFTGLLMASAAALPVLTALTALTAQPALAQDVSAEPTYETVTLAAGFPDDPYQVELLAGGEIDASTIAEGCSGHIANAPDVRLHYTAGEFPLIFSALSDADTTLVINLPDGSWLCDDDSGGNLDPLAGRRSPVSGQYDIWVGTFGANNTAPARLLISEIAPE